MLSSGKFTTRLFVYCSDICLYRRFFFAFFCIVPFSRSCLLFFSRWFDRFSHFSFQLCLTCLQLPSVVVFAFTAPPELLARPHPRGVRPLHTRRTASAELHAPARVGGPAPPLSPGCRRRRRPAGGRGGSTTLHSCFGFPRSHVFYFVTTSLP